MTIEESEAPTPEAITVDHDEFYFGVAKQAWNASKNLRHAMRNLQRELKVGIWPFDCAKLDTLLMRVSTACAEMGTHSEICRLHTMQPPPRWTKRRKKKTPSRRRSRGEPEQNR